MLLTPEQLRLLRRRIELAIELARYYPAQARDNAALAASVLRFPFTPQEHNSGRHKDGDAIV